ncbi:Hypothetical predicted protein [Marmota monax]|uniref:Uncharacterized protein n=1 Tax=Marmota monax TaxID=9995 RepID=A0A5E4AFJ3_MARMO|nr:hypothetical protein GHT09_001485 [Marmota monax]VTJ55471.1 Hypothetical predicted protein [Marmota monax]
MRRVEKISSGEFTAPTLRPVWFGRNRTREEQKLLPALGLGTEKGRASSKAGSQTDRVETSECERPVTSLHSAAAFCWIACDF